MGEIKPESIVELRLKLSDKRWRLTCGKIYRIKNKEGQIVPFLPNDEQLELFRDMIEYNRVVTPKARQRGISTAVQLFFFDDFLFNRNMDVGIIADTKDNAEQIFQNKIKIAWDYLPAWVKYRNGYDGDMNWVIDTNSAQEFKILNTGSTIYVSTTFRGGTLQRLHVSELGRIGAKYPDKEVEVMTGAVEAVPQYGKVVIESTGMGAEGAFFKISKMAKDLQDAGIKPQGMQWKLLFLPWWQDKTYTTDINLPIPEKVQQYFINLKKETGIEVTEGQMKWYALKQDTLGDKMYREYPSTFNEAFYLTLEGTYYEREIVQARQNNRICNVEYDENLLVHTCWDLGGAGGGDDTAIRFFQIYGSEIRWIDYRAGTRMSMKEILTHVVATRGYKYGRHFVPHDIKVTEYSSGDTRLEAAYQLGFKLDMIPVDSYVSNRINEVRQNFWRFWFDQNKCKDGLVKLSNYRRKMQESTGVLMDTPMKNGSQHAADSLGYGVQGFLLYLLERPREESGVTSAYDVQSFYGL